MTARTPCDRQYDVRREENGTWTVFDTQTGKPAEIGSRQATWMSSADAKEILDILNRV